MSATALRSCLAPVLTNVSATACRSRLSVLSSDQKGDRMLVLPQMMKMRLLSVWGGIFLFRHPLLLKKTRRFWKGRATEEPRNRFCQVWIRVIIRSGADLLKTLARTTRTIFLRRIRLTVTEATMERDSKMEGVLM